MFNLFRQTGLLCIILSFLYIHLACPYFQCLDWENDNPKSESNVSNISLKTETENHHLPQSICTRAQSYKIFINPYKDITERITPLKMFKSACLRCAACLAIAQQIDESMEEIEIGSVDPEEEVEMIEDTLKSVCTNGFKGFDLRNYKSHTILMKASWSTTHVSTKMNGQWQSKLREICSRYLENMNLLTFYTILLQKSYAIENYFCRSDGVFRDCTNINFTKNPTITKEDCDTEIPDIRFIAECFV